MAQIRQRDARTGQVYVYEAETRWDPELRQSRYVSRRLVGHVDPDTGEVVPNRPTRARPDSPSARREFVGARALLDGVARESGAAAALGAAAPGDADAALSLAYYMVCEGASSLSRFERWAATHSVPLGRPLPSQRCSELLAGLDEGVRDRFCAAMVAAHGEGDRLLYDTTSISSYSEALRQVRWGNNKDHVPLPQVNLAVLVGESSGVPLSYRHVAGNVADVSTVAELIAEMDPLFRGKVRLVMDRGFWSAANVNAMMGRHYKFLIGLPSRLRLFRDAVDAHGGELRTWGNFDPEGGVYGIRLPHAWAYERARPRKGDVLRERRRSYVYLYYDAARAAEAERDLARLLVECERELASGNRVEAHEPSYDEYFEVVRGRVRGKDDAIAAATARAGYFALFSNEAVEPARALAIYRGKDRIEKRFCDVKSLLGVRTPRVSTERTLDGKLFVTFVALVLAAWLRRRMAETGLDEDYTLQGLLDEVETVELYTQPGRRPRVCEVTAKQRRIFEALGYELRATS